MCICIRYSLQIYQLHYTNDDNAQTICTPVEFASYLDIAREEIRREKIVHARCNDYCEKNTNINVMVLTEVTFAFISYFIRKKNVLDTNFRKK